MFHLSRLMSYFLCACVVLGLVLSVVFLLIGQPVQALAGLVMFIVFTIRLHGRSRIATNKPLLAITDKGIVEFPDDQPYRIPWSLIRFVWYERPWYYSHPMLCIQVDGRFCVCGNRGCWELYASNHATVQRFYALKKKPFDGSPIMEMQRIIAAAFDGDEDAISAIRETGRFLGIGISNIIKGIDPEIVVLGGIITTAWDLIYPEIMKEIRSRVFFELNESRKVIPTSLKERSSLVGAFTLASKEIFKGYKITI